MMFDLEPLLPVRVGINVLIAAAFWAQRQRYPTIGGPGWWALAAVMSTLGAVGLAFRGVWPEVAVIVVSNTAFAATFACLWLGLRHYLEWPMSRGPVMVFLLVFTAIQVTVEYLGSFTPLRQSLFALSVLLFLGLCLRDAWSAWWVQRLPELRGVVGVAAIELLCVLVCAVAVVVLKVPVWRAAPVLALAFLFTSLMRALVYNGLLLYRLRLDGERARQGLMLREADSRALIQNLSAGIMVFRPDHTLSSINGAARRFLGWSDGGANPAVPEPTGPDGGWHMLNDDGTPMRRHDMPFERVLATGQPVQNVIVGLLVGAGGEVRWALCNAYPERHANGGLRHVVLTFIDITSLRAMQAEQKALQAQLAQSQKMEALGTLAGGVAHDFNNILTAILGNADLARDEVPPGAPVRESLDEISTAARRGRELVRQILAFSRQQPAERTEVSMADIVAESCGLLRAALPPKVQLSHSAAPDTPPVLADATQLGQVVLNLGTNALHALEGMSGQVEMRVDAVSPDAPGVPPEVAQVCRAGGLGAVRLRVSDTGCGISDAVRARMFDPFFTTKPVGKGTGLGLPVVLGIVQVHGGAIEVNTAPGQGTTFTLYFPAARAGREPMGDPGNHGTMTAPSPQPQPALAASVVTPHSAPADSAPAQAPHILYLDDDETLVFLVKRLLLRRGFRVTALGSQKQAIEAVREQPHEYALLLTDFNMPGQSGLDVARAALAINPALTVAVTSGFITDELQAEARSAGVREVIFKTDAVESFCDVVTRLIQPPVA